jgi:hypothetical protein
MHASREGPEIRKQVVVVDVLAQQFAQRLVSGCHLIFLLAQNEFGMQ